MGSRSGAIAVLCRRWRKRGVPPHNSLERGRRRRDGGKEGDGIQRAAHTAGRRSSGKLIRGRESKEPAADGVRFKRLLL
jgi:hypothetical protein